MTAGSAAAYGGTSIAQAPTITPGQQLFGDTSIGNYPRSCRDHGTADFWKLQLVAGDDVTINWETTGDYLRVIDVWPANTDDFNINNREPFQIFFLGANRKQQSKFTANASGAYPLVFNNSCGGTGPYSFVTYVTHRLTLFAPRAPRASTRTTRLVVRVRTPDGQPITDSRLRVKLEGSWRGTWHGLASAAPQSGRASLSFKVPRSLRGTRIRLRIRAGGGGYRSATLSRAATVR